MRIYEELFIVKPDAPDEEVDAFVEQLRGQLTTAGATVDKVEKWCHSSVAYKVGSKPCPRRVLRAVSIQLRGRRGEGTGAPAARFRRRC